MRVELIKRSTRQVVLQMLEIIYVLPKKEGIVENNTKLTDWWRELMVASFLGIALGSREGCCSWQGKWGDVLGMI